MGKDKEKEKKSYGLAKVRNLNYSAAEEDLLCELVVKHQKVLLDKAINNQSNLQKKDTWQTIENEFNASPVAKTFRSSKHLISKFKNIKVNLRKGYVANKLAGHPTGDGKPTRDVDEQQSAAKQKLQATITASFEDLDPNVDNDDDDGEAHLATRGSSPTSEAQAENPEDSNEEADVDSNPMTPEYLSSICESDSDTSTANLSASQSKRKKITRRADLGQTKTFDDDIKKAVDAKAAFYRNEERRAAERHELQMQMWRAEREEKKEAHERSVEEHRLRVELLKVQIESVKRKRPGSPIDGM